VHDQQNAKRRIQCKKFLELKKKEFKRSKPTKKVSSPKKTPSGDNNQTQGVESPTQDSKLKPSP
jgi:hypothetical protein